MQKSRRLETMTNNKRLITSITRRRRNHKVGRRRCLKGLLLHRQSLLSPIFRPSRHFKRTDLRHALAHAIIQYDRILRVGLKSKYWSIVSVSGRSGVLIDPSGKLLRFETVSSTNGCRQLVESRFVDFGDGARFCFFFSYDGTLGNHPWSCERHGLWRAGGEQYSRMLNRSCSGRCRYVVKSHTESWLVGCLDSLWVAIGEVRLWHS